MESNIADIKNRVTQLAALFQELTGLYGVDHQMIHQAAQEYGQLSNQFELCTQNLARSNRSVVELQQYVVRLTDSINNNFPLAQLQQILRENQKDFAAIMQKKAEVEKILRKITYPFGSEPKAGEQPQRQDTPRIDPAQFQQARAGSKPLGREISQQLPEVLEETIADPSTLPAITTAQQITSPTSRSSHPSPQETQLLEWESPRASLPSLPQGSPVSPKKTEKRHQCLAPARKSPKLTYSFTQVSPWQPPSAWQRQGGGTRMRTFLPAIRKKKISKNTRYRLQNYQFIPFLDRNKLSKVI